jgi:hypothetical protein
MTKAMTRRLRRLEKQLLPDEESESTRILMERLAWARWRMAGHNGSAESAPAERPLPPKARASTHAQQMVDRLNAGRTRMNDRNRALKEVQPP